MANMIGYDPQQLEAGLDRRLSLLSKGEGNTHAIFLGISIDFRACAFERILAKDSEEAQTYYYLAAVAEVLASQLHAASPGGAGGHSLLYPLLSGYEPVLAWHAQFQLANFLGAPRYPACFNINKYQYYSVLPRLALARDWELLVSRCEQALLGNPRECKLFQIDCRFYIALAEGNVSGMVDCILELLTPKIKRGRTKDNYWIIDTRLFNPWALMLTKLAQYFGYEFGVSHPDLPPELLSFGRKDAFTVAEKFACFKNVNLFAPFPSEVKEWCGEVSRFSPRPPHESPLTFREQCKMLGIES